MLEEIVYCNTDVKQGRKADIFLTMYRISSLFALAEGQKATNESMDKVLWRVAISPAETCEEELDDNDPCHGRG